MDSKAHTLHILFFPFMAAGHMIPMVDMAKLFSVHGVKTAILTTPANAPTLPSSHNPITLHIVPFPSTPGLPAGCENLSSLPSDTLVPNFLAAVSMLRQPFDHLLSSLRPDCVISDIFLPWTFDVAAAHCIPRLVFHGTCFFSLCARAALDQHTTLSPDATTVTIPGLPHRIEMLRSQLDKPGPAFKELFKLMKEAELKSYGVVANTFYELEPDYARHFREVLRRRAWHVGPVSLCNYNKQDKISRGNTGSAAVGADACVAWLDRKPDGSVVYVCFGSMCDFTAAQLHELALGLGCSDHPFICVVRDGVADWVPRGIEKRGLIISGWAPQVLILDHPAVGAFVTHCGWNSVLEGVSAGVPMVTWPLYAEQFYNERLVVEVLGIGVEVGASVYALVAEERPVVEAAAVERAVREVMGGGEEARRRRRKVRELREAAKMAVGDGGSSFADVEGLIKEFMGKPKISDREVMKCENLCPSQDKY